MKSKTFVVFQTNAAFGEHRFAAGIADPGQSGLADGFRCAANGMLHADTAAVTDLGKIDEALLNRIQAIISGSNKLQWSIVQLAFG